MRRLVPLVLLVVGVPSAAGAEGGPVVRERREVLVSGVRETWRLEWTRPPAEACTPEEGFTCPCAGFAYGERGDLDLVRSRPGQPEERMKLTPLFAGGEMQAADPPEALLRRWPARDGDVHRPPTPAEVRRRPALTVMDVAAPVPGGDGAGFLLQVDAEPCGKRIAVWVGVTPDRPRLHILGTRTHPDRPLRMRVEAWEQLRRQGRAKIVEWPCGDHGAEEQGEIEVAWTKGQPDPTRRTFACTPSGRRGRLLRTERF